MRHVEIVRPGGLYETTDDLPVMRTNLKYAAALQNVAVTLFTELLPQVVGASKQRHVVRMFKINQADNSCIAMGTALIMTRRELVEA